MLMLDVKPSDPQQMLVRMMDGVNSKLPLAY